MKSDKKLLEIYETAKGDNHFFTFDDFKKHARKFLKDVRNRSTYCHINPSRSGMSRTFNFETYNMLLNICYNEKFTWDVVKVSGCGMDMHWYLKFTTCEMLSTKGELRKFDYNSASSRGVTL